MSPLRTEELPLSSREQAMLAMAVHVLGNILHREPLGVVWRKGLRLGITPFGIDQASWILVALSQVDWPAIIARAAAVRAEGDKTS